MTVGAKSQMKQKPFTAAQRSSASTDRLNAELPTVVHLFRNQLEKLISNMFPVTTEAKFLSAALSRSSKTTEIPFSHVCELKFQMKKDAVEMKTTAQLQSRLHELHNFS